MLCVGVLSFSLKLSNAGISNMSISSRGVMVKNGARVYDFDAGRRLDDRGRHSGNMKPHDFASSDASSGIAEGR